MKKTIIAGAISGLLATGMLLYSCQKEQQTGNPANTQNEYKVSASNNLLAFKTVEDYKAIADNPSAEAKIKFTNYASNMNGFTPMSKLTATETRGTDHEDIESDFLKGILNKDAAVQIGDYIYKISVKKEKVFVLHKSDISNYKDVVAGNTNNAKVRSFSINDEVLTLTGNKSTLRGSGNSEGTMNYPDDGGTGGGGGGSGGTTCETGISNQYDGKVISENGQATNITTVAHYYRYGIYFTLFARILDVPPTNSPYVFDFTGGIPASAGYVYYAKRKECNTPVSYPRVDPGRFINNTTQEYQSYDGSKTLNEVYFFYRVKNKNTSQYCTLYVGFRQNK